MAATATRRIEEPPLSKEVGELYDRLWKIGKESLEALGIETVHFERIRDYNELRRILKKTGDVESGRQMDEIIKKVNVDFAKQNGLPETIKDDERLIKFFSEYVKKKFGREMDIFVSTKEMRMGVGTNTIWLSEGETLLHSLAGVYHELNHLDRPYAKEISEVQLIVSPLFKTKMQKEDILDFFEKLAGAPREVINDVLTAHMANRMFNPILFMIDLYDLGVYQPKDERERQCLEYSKFCLNPEMRRAYARYSEGRAIVAEMGVIEDKDNFLTAYHVLNSLINIAELTPSSYSSGDARHDARSMEGLRFYYSLREQVGADNLAKLEKRCGEKGFVPGISKGGKLVLVNVRKVEMFEVDVEKLKAGVTDINELIGKVKFPEKMS
jgi:hypothetical protein